MTFFLSERYVLSFQARSPLIRISCVNKRSLQVECQTYDQPAHVRIVYKEPGRSAAIVHIQVAPSSLQDYFLEFVSQYSNHLIIRISPPPPASPQIVTTAFSLSGI